MRINVHILNVYINFDPSGRKDNYFKTFFIQKNYC